MITGTADPAYRWIIVLADPRADVALINTLGLVGIASLRDFLMLSLCNR